MLIQCAIVVVLVVGPWLVGAMFVRHSRSRSRGMLLGMVIYLTLIVIPNSYPFSMLPGTPWDVDWGYWVPPVSSFHEALGGIGVLLLLLVPHKPPPVDPEFPPRRRRAAHGDDALCPECGYDLTGNASGTCPECGRALPKGNPGDGAVAR